MCNAVQIKSTLTICWVGGRLSLPEERWAEGEQEGEAKWPERSQGLMQYEIRIFFIWGIKEFYLNDRSAWLWQIQNLNDVFSKYPNLLPDFGSSSKCVLQCHVPPLFKPFHMTSQVVLISFRCLITNTDTQRLEVICSGFSNILV